MKTDCLSQRANSTAYYLLALDIDSSVTPNVKLFCKTDLIEQSDRIEISESGFGSGQFDYDPNSGSLFFEDEEFVVLENKPSFSDVQSRFYAA